MSPDKYVVNPILVQAFDGGASVVPDTQPACRTDLADEVKQRIDGQIAVGPSESRHFDVSDGSSIGRLSTDRRDDLSVGVSIARGIGNRAARMYFLTETAATVPVYGSNYLLSAKDNLSDGDHDLILRTEEGLAEVAARIADRISSDSPELQLRDGKTYASIPGHASLVPVSGWWTFFPDGSRKLMPNIPSCEMFMAATVLDQSDFGDVVVRVVPYGMEDREVAAHRILGHMNKPVDALSVVVAPSGDIKKIRRWGDISAIPEVINDTYQLMRVDGLASRTSSRLSEGSKLECSNANSHLESGFPVNKQRSLAEAYSALVDGPYRMIRMYEKFKPSSADISLTLSELSGLLHEGDEARVSLLGQEYVPGKNTNSIVESRFAINRPGDHAIDGIDLELAVVFSRVDEVDAWAIGSASSDRPSLVEFADRLSDIDKAYYLLMTGKINEQ